MKNALNNQAGMLGNMFLWLVANLKQGVIYFIKQACGNEIMPSVYLTARLRCIYNDFALRAHRDHDFNGALN